MPLSFNMKSAVNFPLRSKRTGKASINTLEPKKTANQVLHELILFMYGISWVLLSQFSARWSDAVHAIREKARSFLIKLFLFKVSQSKVVVAGISEVIFKFTNFYLVIVVKMVGLSVEKKFKTEPISIKNT